MNIDITDRGAVPGGKAAPPSPPGYPGRWRPPQNCPAPRSRADRPPPDGVSNALTRPCILDLPARVPFPIRYEHPETPFPSPHLTKICLRISGCRYGYSIHETLSFSTAFEKIPPPLEPSSDRKIPRRTGTDPAGDFFSCSLSPRSETYRPFRRAGAGP